MKGVDAGLPHPPCFYPYPPVQVYYNGNVSWHPPTDTPLEYHAPLAVRTVDVG